MDLERLKDVIPFKFRVQSYSKDKKKASVVAYIDARDVMDRLDEVVGMGNWKKSFYEVKGNLFCSVSIKINGEWVEMSDCGKESRTDKEKGEASDAFKRACIAWGIGRFLYHIPIQWADTDGIGEYPKLVSNGNTIKDISEFFFLKLKREGKLPQNVSKNIPVTSEKTEIEPEKKEIVTSEKVTNIDKKTSLLEWTEKHLNNANSTKDCLAVKAKMQEKNPKFIDTEEFKSLFKSFYDEFDIREKTIQSLDLAIKNKSSFVAYVKQLEANNPELKKVNWFQDHVLMLSVDHKVGINQDIFKVGG